MVCPNCKSENVLVQQVQSGNISAGQNKVVMMPAKRSKGCLYWMCIGVIWEPIKFIMFGWIKLLVGGRRRGGINLSGNKVFYKTMCTCQNCGNAWKI